MEVSELISLIKSANNLVFLTGAGVSTHSGIPDYRSKTGIYNNMQNEEILSVDNLHNHPEILRDFVLRNMYFPDAKPNIVHQVIADLSNRKGFLITQNIDGLDKLAGNNHVIEFHKNIQFAYCSVCGKHVSMDFYKNHLTHEEDGGLYRPNFTLYGEGIEPGNIENSVSEISSADLIIVAGTSLKVYPFAGLIQYKKASTPVVIINNELPQNLNNSIHFIQGDVVDVFKEIKKAY
ncbi:NAD-dependent protein deacylase [Companilactobacillus metriopterae]|uniref:NAD-dependent protein deacylase n=1 Tax=Companilactobacillus metriopterae TaxID=1909267 RepID=UPI00100A4A16|nr:NAD-dependent protein deacylase [Companilactobacillus metriopterae]